MSTFTKPKQKRLSPKLRKAIAADFETHLDNGIPPWALHELFEAIADDHNCEIRCVEATIPYFKWLQTRKASPTLY
jgi:hypothetical protein